MLYMVWEHVIQRLLIWESNSIHIHIKSRRAWNPQMAAVKPNTHFNHGIISPQIKLSLWVLHQRAFPIQPILWTTRNPNKSQSHVCSSLNPVKSLFNPIKITITKHQIPTSSPQRAAQWRARCAAHRVGWEQIALEGSSAFSWPNMAIPAENVGFALQNTLRAMVSPRKI